MAMALRQLVSMTHPASPADLYSQIWGGHKLYMIMDRKKLQETTCTPAFQLLTDVMLFWALSR